MSHFMTAALPTGTTLDLVRPEPPALPAGLNSNDRNLKLRILGQQVIDGTFEGVSIGDDGSPDGRGRIPPPR